MTIPCALAEHIQRVAFLAQGPTVEEDLGGVLLMLAVFAALVVLIGLMTIRRRGHSHPTRSSPADPFDDARRDEPVGVSGERVPSNLRR